MFSGVMEEEHWLGTIKGLISNSKKQNTAKQMKFSINDFFSKFDTILYFSGNYATLLSLSFREVSLNTQNCQHNHFFLGAT